MPEQRITVHKVVLAKDILQVLFAACSRVCLVQRRLIVVVLIRVAGHRRDGKVAIVAAEIRLTHSSVLAAVIARALHVLFLAHEGQRRTN